MEYINITARQRNTQIHVGVLNN